MRISEKVVGFSKFILSCCSPQCGQRRSFLISFSERTSPVSSSSVPTTFSISSGERRSRLQLLAGGAEKFPYQPGIPDMDDRFRKFNVAEVAGALARLLVAGLAPQAGIDDPKVEIHQSLRVGEPVIIVGVCPDDLPAHSWYESLLGRVTRTRSFLFVLGLACVFLLHHVFKFHSRCDPHTLHLIEERA